MPISDGMAADRGLAMPSGNLSTVAQSALEVDSIDTDDEWDWDARVSSITSSVLDYEYENGRRYHGYRAGVYPLPNDEKELDRLDIQHHVFTLALSGELYLAPLDKPRRVLDIGTGTGLWAIEMADSHPDANVLGVDLSPIQPDLVPSNAHFEIDDIESSWMYKPDYFDFIHSRIMIGAIRNWRKLIKRSFNHLKPGGWMEIQELDPNITSDDGTHILSPCNREYNVKIVEASEKYGNPVPRHGEWKKMMEDAGYVDVRAHYFKLPINTWPKDPRLKEVGKYQLLNYFEGYEAIGIGLFTRALGWTEPEFQVFLAKIRNELRDRNIHVYQYFTVCYGRKPLNAETVSRQTTPSSADASLANLSINANSYNPRHPVSSIPSSLQYQSPPTPEDVGFEHVPNPQPTKADCPDPSIVSSVPGPMTFRINRSGEVIRLHHGETLQQHPDTYFHFTIPNDDECTIPPMPGNLTIDVHGDTTVIGNDGQEDKKDSIMSTTTISA